MRLQWIMLGVTAALLSGCVTDEVKQPQLQVPTKYPLKMWLGAEPHYEPYHRK